MRDSLNQIGISEEVLEEGKTLHNFASKAYNDSNAAKKRRIEAYKVYSRKSEVLIEQFMIDRKKAKIVFLSDDLAISVTEIQLSSYQ
jgi:hypothetical protein